MSLYLNSRISENEDEELLRLQECYEELERERLDWIKSHTDSEADYIEGCRVMGYPPALDKDPNDKPLPIL